MTNPCTPLWMLTLLLTASSVTAGESYQASLKAGDESRSRNDYPAAISAFDRAVEQAAHTTERALALSKKAVAHLNIELTHHYNLRGGSPSAGAWAWRGVGTTSPPVPPLWHRGRTRDTRS